MKGRTLQPLNADLTGSGSCPEVRLSASGVYGPARHTVLRVSVITRLSTQELTVDPGGEAILDVLIRNNGQVVDEFTVEVLGDSAPWTEVGPAVIRLFPGTDQTAQIIFRPPRVAATVAKTVPFGVRVRSREDAQASSVEEGYLHVNPFADTVAELLPGTSRGSTRGRHDVAVDNRGNTTIDAEIVPIDPANELRFQVRPPNVVAGPGNASMARLVVRPKRRFWRGQPKTRPFQVSVRPKGQTPIQLTGALLQEALLPRWLAPAALALIGVLLAGTLLWFTVLRPTLQTAAKDAAQQAANAAIAGPLAKQAAASDQQAKDIKTLQGQITPSPSAGGTGTGGTATALGDPFDGRLVVTGTDFKVADKTTVSLTDVIFENPNADTGQISLKRINADGTAVLLDPKLENFRDLDYHFVSPITLRAGDLLRLDLSGCKPASGSTCTADLYFTGYQKKTT